MTARQQRRHEERKARKDAYKTEKRAIEESADHSMRAEANRQNSQHSTGPKTPAGKANSSKNAFKHGLYSRQLILPGEDSAELDALREDLRREHQPGNTTEEILVNELAEHYWRLRRMRKYEARVMGSGTLETLEKGFAILPIIQRTMASAERGFHKALAALRQLQKDRGFVPQVSGKQLESISQNPAEAPGEASLISRQAGFVSQNGHSQAAGPSIAETPAAVHPEHSHRIAA